MSSKPKSKAKPKARPNARPNARPKTKPTARKPPRVAKPKKTATAKAPAPADWRTATLARMRALILEADPAMIEERKWAKKTNPAGVPVFSHDGIVCTGETYKNVVKLTFMHGVALPDPGGLFNAGLDGNVRRAIDIAEGEMVDADAFKALILAAVAHNAGKR